MRFHYISPSILPSRSANSVHVAMQCEGLARAGAEVTLYAKRAMPDEAALLPAVRDFYGIDPSGIRLVSYHTTSGFGDQSRITAIALSNLHRGPWPDAILSRNLYASFVVGVLERKPLLFETHQLETGIRGAMQRTIMTRPWVITVLISHSQVECLEEHHGVRPFRPIVLHDAAPDGITPLPRADRRRLLAEITNQAEGHWDAVCGYFGHLYAGRGIEIIEAMAKAHPNSLFLVYGGNESDVQRRRAANALPNLYFAGHVPHPVAQQVMRSVDVLLMPYQESVSIGIKGHDTARWMSPMKMFEYLASGVPLISSDLPSLREILKDGENCMLAHPGQPDAWIAALGRLTTDPVLSQTLGQRGHENYLANHTWTQRARLLLAAAEAL